MRISDWSSDVCSSDLRSNTMQIETCCGSTIEPRHRQWVVCFAVKDFQCPSIAAWLGFDARLDDASNIYLCRGKVERYIGWIGAVSSAAAFGVENHQENRHADHFRRPGATTQIEQANRRTPGTHRLH